MVGDGFSDVMGQNCFSDLDCCRHELTEIFNNQSDRIKGLIDTMLSELRLLKEANIVRHHSYH